MPLARQARNIHSSPPGISRWRFFLGLADRRPAPADAAEDPIDPDSGGQQDS